MAEWRERTLPWRRHFFYYDHELDESRPYLHPKELMNLF
jgi:hypothetical protein